MGRDYQGSVAKSMKGKECLPWDSVRLLYPIPALTVAIDEPDKKAGTESYNCAYRLKNL